MSANVSNKGGGENITPEVTAQTSLVTEILESLVGKVTLANATPETLLEGYSAYVAGKLVVGTLPIEKTKIDYGTLTADVSGESIATVNHTLKKSPSYMMLLPKSVNRSTNVFLASIVGNTGLIEGSTYKQIIVYINNNIMSAERITNTSTYEVTYDDSTITFRTGTTYPLKGSYIWIALA